MKGHLDPFQGSTSGDKLLPNFKFSKILSHPTKCLYPFGFSGCLLTFVLRPVHRCVLRLHRKPAYQPGCQASLCGARAVGDLFLITGTVEKTGRFHGISDTMIQEIFQEVTPFFLKEDHGNSQWSSYDWFCVLFDCYFFRWYWSVGCCFIYSKLLLGSFLCPVVNTGNTPDICWRKLTSRTLIPFWQSVSAYQRPWLQNSKKQKAALEEGSLLLARAHFQPSCIPFPFWHPVFEGKALKWHFYSLGSCIPEK